MDKKNKIALIAAVLLVISLSHYLLVITEGHFRAVEFFSVLVIGVLLGVVVTIKVVKR